MPHEVTLRNVDGTLGVVLPDDLADHHRFEEGDRVHLIETSQGILIVPYDADFADAMQVYEDGVDTYTDALQTLADKASEYRS